MEQKVFKLKDFAQDVSIAVKDAQASPYDRFVGLEHYDSGEPVITRFTDTSLLSSSVKEFHTNDILIARRNVYLRRAGIAFFDGLTSGDSIVLRIYDDCNKRTGINKEDAIKIIPFILNSNHFWAYANKHADGMNSKRISKEMLYNYEFTLPSIEDMKLLADKLWSAYRLKESYKKLLAATEEMVKSQFIEMFGSVDDNPKSYDIKKVGDFAECFAGATPSTKISSYWDNGNIPWMSSGEVHKARVQDTDAKITQQGYDGCSTKMVPIHSIVIALAGQGKTRGTVAINDIELCTNQSLCAIVPNEEVNYEYLFHNLRGRYKELRSMSGDVDGRGGLNQKHIQSIKVIVPPMSEQMKFVSIARQADKSGFDGLKSQFIEMFGNPLSSVQRYPLKNLGECCELNPRRPSLDLEDTDNVSFVPMPSVSENGYLQDVSDEEYGKVKKGFTYFENGDVLFAKITPCMENGKGAIAEGLTNNIGMGSTEFHVLRPIEGVSSPYWLLALTRLPIFRERASKNMTGTGGQKRVPANYLENFMVGLPPIEEQNRYENIYKQADKSGSVLLKLSSR